eukprot:2423292-Amphidinium_carterae.2
MTRKSAATLLSGLGQPRDPHESEMYIARALLVFNQPLKRALRPVLCSSSLVASSTDDQSLVDRAPPHITTTATV